MIQQFVLADKPQSTPELSRSTGVGDQLKTMQSGGEFRFDNLDGSDPGVGLIDVGARDAVLAAPAAGATAEDLVLHVTLAGLVAAAADDDRAAAAAVANLLVRGDLTGGFQQCFHESMNGRVISVDGGGKARINHAALADLDIDYLCQSIIDRQCRIGQAGEQVTAGGAHDG